MPMGRIEPYRPPRPTIRELMEGRPAGADEGGILPKGYQGEAAQVRPGRRTGRRPRGACERARYSPGAGKISGKHTEQESSSKRAGRGGKGGETREGGEERDAR